MENFILIYRILRILEHSMDEELFDCRLLEKEALGISEAKWRRIMFMLSKEGYVAGIESFYSVGSMLPNIYFTNPEITLKGMEYLAGNPIMEKVRHELVMDDNETLV